MLKKTLPLFLLTSFITQSAFSSCSEILGKTEIKKSDVGEIIQDVGLVISSAGGGMTSTGYSATSSSASTTAGAASMIVPGWIVLGSGIVISAVGGVIQLTQPERKAINDVYTLFNQADLGTGITFIRFSNSVRKAANKTAEELPNKIIAELIREGDNKELFCPRNAEDNTQFNVMTIDQIRSTVVEQVI
jgi:hypothetical protein